MKKNIDKTNIARRASICFLVLIIVACKPTNNSPSSELSTESLDIKITKTPLSSTLSPSNSEKEFTPYPTPDPAHIAYPELPVLVQHTILPGETLELIAYSYGINSAWLAEYNQLEDTDQVSAGLVIEIPVPVLGSNFKIIPDSELVYGPSSISFDTRAFIKSRGGYLANYGEEIDGKYLDAAEIIDLVVQRYSVNPRLLIALVQHQSGWLDCAASAQNGKMASML
ncbi:MAG: LysM peptidoglycan-binding domain-containing protein [Anaerolineae bacterium]|jgi:LasA protease|nr:LysM peptidoglycan-binding domain-containing protein [Anaerolineae bacterium]